MDTMTKIAIGFAFAFILSLCGLLAFYVLREERKNAGKEMDEFDERQKNIRRKGFTIGFWVLLGCYTILAFFKECGVFNFENEIIELVFAAYISFAVVMTYLIWHDASLTPLQEKMNPNKIRYLCFSFGGSCLGASIMLIVNKPEGLGGLCDMFIMTSIFFFYVGINQIAKQSHDEKHKKISDDEEQGEE